MANQCPKCAAHNPPGVKFCGECGTSLVPARDLRAEPTKTLEIPTLDLPAGSMFAGRYRIIEDLGHGGMGWVYRAFDTELNEEVAIKFIRPDISADKKTLERFRNELKLARKIAHRNVGKMYELMDDQGLHFITMEYVPGEDLASFIRRSRQLTPGTAVLMAEEICEGLAEAHRVGVIHRDLKPSNIIIDREGNARIMDFGIARSVESRDVTGAGVMIGTLHYMSPEQAQGREADQRADIYSLGVMLYEMVTGRLPFEGETPLDVARQHIETVPRDPKAISPQVPAALSRLIMRCLEKDKNRRFQSAPEVLAELRRIEGELTSETAQAGRRWPVLRPLVSLAAGKRIAVLLIVLAAAGTIIWRLAAPRGTPEPPPARRSIAVLPFMDLSPQQDQEWLALGIADTLSNSLGRARGLRVPAFTSSLAFRGKREDIREIGRKLNVENVLEGSLQVSGDDLRISVDLISAKDGFRLWSGQFDRKRRDELAVQDEIALEVVRALKLQLLGEEEARLTAKYTEDLQAYDLYLQGRFNWEKRTKEGLLKSVDFYNEALLRDPKYALAYAGLADAYWILGDNAYLPESEAFPKAKEAALRALKLDAGISDAHAAMGAILASSDWDWPAARKELELAIRLSPGNAQARHRYAYLLTFLGRHDEAVREVRFARDLDPLAPRIAANVGAVLFFARRFDEALRELKGVMAQFPDHLAVYAYASDVCAATGRYDEGFGYCRKITEIAGFEPEWLKARLYAKQGKRKEAEESIKGMEAQAKEFNLGPILFAEIYSLLGDRERAFSLINEGYAGRDSYLSYLKVDPWLDPLRSDPRFKSLLRKMQLD